METASSRLVGVGGVSQLEQRRANILGAPDGSLVSVGDWGGLVRGTMKLGPHLRFHSKYTRMTTLCARGNPISTSLESLEDVAKIGEAIITPTDDRYERAIANCGREVGLIFAND